MPSDPRRVPPLERRSSLALVSAVLTLVLARAPASRADYAPIHGIRMYYEVRGKGPVLVLLHGGGGSGLQFEKQIPALETRHRLVIPDMCAQGRSTDRPGPLTYHAMAEDVIALMDDLGVRRFDVLGWSDGGNTGLDLAIHHRERLRHLVTFGANFSPQSRPSPCTTKRRSPRSSTCGRRNRISPSRSWARSARRR
ncbi:MAG: alpha/beta fold hydrolase [Candidatus Eisenbacteria bacterium]|uniref:Alpha/beta fold hydrolase n=1 Tax=Eiseniibacteriota bacterium TaxID=2212470 RepID=A0A538UAF0_UNCEI|nr:MAG: alpha/beta fold hydrolase [Candidatus Eisenbacteria bacterium]